MGDAEKPKITFVSPYLDILGGGERFLLSVASYFQNKAYVTLFWNDEKIKRQAYFKLGIDLEKVKIEKVPPKRLNFILKLTSQNFLFYMTDGSLFFSPCYHNYLIIQSPAHIPKNSFINSIKLSRFETIICYSEFVKKYIKLRLNKNASVVPPPITIDKFKRQKKENLILSVGRFFPWLHSKKQEILVTAFKKLYLGGLKNWRLVLVGSIDKGGEDYFKKIQKMTVGYPIEIIPNISFDDLTRLYGRAKIYWHATGFGEDLERFPERAEHFGITTVEAMSATAVPIVFAGGGQKEIVKEGENGFLWQTPEELLEKTRKLIDDENKLISVSRQANKDSLNYSKEKFIQRIQELTNLS